MISEILSAGKPRRISASKTRRRRTGGARCARAFQSLSNAFRRAASSRSSAPSSANASAIVSFAKPRDAELPLDPRAAVPGAPKPDGRARGREVVEETLLGQPVERLRDRAGHEAPFAERPRELRAAARPDRQQAQGPLAGRRRGRGLPGR